MFFHILYADLVLETGFQAGVRDSGVHYFKPAFPHCCRLY